MSSRTRFLATLALAATAVTNACNPPDEGAGDRASTSEAVVRPPATRRVAVLLLHYGEPLIFGPDFYDFVLFSGPASVKAFYLDASHGALNLEGHVFDWTLTERSPVCDDQHAIQSRALAAAQAAHIDLAPFDHVAIVLADGCRSGGVAEIGTP